MVHTFANEPVESLETVRFVGSVAIGARRRRRKQAVIDGRPAAKDAHVCGAGRARVEGQHERRHGAVVAGRRLRRSAGTPARQRAQPPVGRRVLVHLGPVQMKVQRQVITFPTSAIKSKQKEG